MSHRWSRVTLIEDYVRLVQTNYNFRFLWTSQVISLLGDWFNLIASAALVAKLTGSGLAIGGLFLARLLPPFLLGPVAGVVADRFERRRILIISDLLRAAVVLGFLFIQSKETVWLLYFLTVIQLSISAFFEPTRAAVLPSLVSRSELITANALSSATWSIMLALGAATGGLATALLGTTSAFLLDSATYLISAWFLTRINFAPKASLGTEAGYNSGWRLLTDGFNYLRRHRRVLVIALLKSSSSLAFGGVEIVQVIFARAYFPLGTDGSGTLGLIYFVVGLGTGFGPLVAHRLTGERVWPMYWAILTAYLMMATGYLLLGWGANLEIILLATLVRTLGTGINWVYSSVLLQLLVPPEFLGRVFAFDLAMMTLAASISTFYAGWAQDNFGFGPHEISFSLAATCIVMMAGWLTFMKISAQPNNAITCQDEP